MEPKIYVGVFYHRMIGMLSYYAYDTQHPPICRTQAIIDVCDMLVPELKSQQFDTSRLERVIADARRNIGAKQASSVD